ncbi:MAG: precorrin-6y C5,15-methyltransferase (decarboxylating) subunit CbiE [Kiritimatiellia bacterium]|jgi:precorrin-6y C5,15-methyltransferase (decarboxylating) CbiE subunit|nr:precorrin-6y C5,15-methyltransferase (decarboxylating) subunit CbiE [Kiritimatiellia bacterium]
MITIVGCGPGADDYLTMAAQSAIDQADVLVGAPRLLELRKSGAVVKIAVTAHIDDALEKIGKHHAGNRRIAVLVTGDPGIFSLARRVIKAFGLENCRVIPGISSVQTAFARIGLNWNDARILSAHHELPDIDALDIESTTKMAVLSGRDDVLQWLQQLVARLNNRVTLFACENLTLDNETISELSTADLTDRSFSSRCVFLVIRKDQSI